MVIPGPPAPPGTPVPGLPRPVAGSLYAVSRYGTARRRGEVIAETRRRLWGLRLLIGAWAVMIGVTLWPVVDWAGWPYAAGTHTPMLGLLVVLARFARAERRWLASLQDAAERT
jgi:hypothetical protein